MQEDEITRETKVHLALQPLAMCRQQMRMAKDLLQCAYYSCEDCKSVHPTHILIQFVLDPQKNPLPNWQRDLGALLDQHLEKHQ